MKPKAIPQSPLEHGDHPEIDQSALLDATKTQAYQSLIGTMQCGVTPSRIDITTTIMTQLGFKVTSREGHLE